MWTRTQPPVVVVLRLFVVGIGCMLCWAGGLLSSTLLAHPRSGESSAGFILMALIGGLGALGAGTLVMGIQWDAALPAKDEPPVFEGRPPLPPWLRAALALAAVSLVAQVGAAAWGPWPPWRMEARAHLVLWSVGFAAAVAGVQGLVMRRRVGWLAVVLVGPFVAALLIDDLRAARAWTPDAALNAVGHAALLAAALACVAATRWRWALR